MSSRGARTARGLTAALIAVFVAAFSHSAAGGQTPSLLATVLALAFAAPACVALAGRGLSLWRLSLSVVLSQAVFHLLFSLRGGGPSVFAAHSGHLHPGEHLALVASAAGTADSASAMVMLPGPIMWAGHAFGALVTIVALRYGEHALLRMLQLAAVRVVRIARRLVPTSLPPRVSSSFDAPLALRERIARNGLLRHRGPPAVLAF